MNPFLLSGYKSKEYFCDREDETNKLLQAIRNSRNVTLVSERRLGKTGLLRHLENIINQEFIFIYVDLYPSLSLKDFVYLLSNAVLKKLEPFSEKVIKQITGFFAGLSPRFSFDPQSGAPSLELSVNNQSDAEMSVSKLFEYIRDSEKKVAVAFDEFQQISKYPGKNVEATLRTEIQKDNSSSFIFCGSQTHLLLSMFNEYSRPFYQSTEIMSLGKIEKNKYAAFIAGHFKKNNKQISETTAELIYELNDGITYNVQFYCNKLFALNEREITREMAMAILDEILLENEVVYYNYRELVSDLQFSVLKAVAKEKTVEKPFSMQFLQKYNFGSASSVKSAIEILVKKGILTFGKELRVTDLYFSLWLAKQL